MSPDNPNSDRFPMSGLGCDFNRSTQHFIKIAEDGVYAGESMELSRFHSGRESGAVGPLEASRGAEVDWASVWRTLIVCLSPVDAIRGDRNPSREDQCRCCVDRLKWQHQADVRGKQRCQSVIVSKVPHGSPREALNIVADTTPRYCSVRPAFMYWLERFWIVKTA